MTPRRTAFVLASLLTVGACAADGPGAPPAAGEAAAPVAVVEIARSRFSQTELTVAAATTVRFVNLDGFDHTVTSLDDAPLRFDSGLLGEADTFEFTFDEPGEYRYFCEVHPTMRAVVVVT